MKIVSLRQTFQKIMGLAALTMLLYACAPQAPSTAAIRQIEATKTPAAAQVPTDTIVPTATSTPIPPALPVFSNQVLAKIDFQDGSTGWGIAVNGNGAVVRTVDGGKTWYNATPAGAGSIGISTDLFVLNQETVWVLRPGLDFYSGTLYRSTDGGVSWTTVQVPFGEAFIQFLNEKTGRALADRGAAAGSEVVELFQTVDGGNTWTSVFNDDPSRDGSSQSLPVNGIKNGMTFLNAENGWVTGSVPSQGEVYLYTTHNGGASWSQQSLNLPSGYDAYQYVPETPTFFGNLGFLPVMIHLPQRIDFTFYTSQDGGMSWSGDPNDPARVIQAGIPALADAGHILSWDGGPKLFFSTDGAQTWMSVATSPDLGGRLSQVQLVPAPANRFTGWALTQVDENGHSSLYRTIDGVSWTQVNP